MTITKKIRNDVYEIAYWYKKYSCSTIFEEEKYLQIYNLYVSAFVRRYDIKESQINQLFFINDKDEIIVCSDWILSFYLNHRKTEVIHKNIKKYK
jgi:hypothetical protein